MVRGDNGFGALGAEVRARPWVYASAAGVAVVVFFVALAAWHGAFLRAPRVLELSVDAQAAPGFALQREDGHVAASFELHYPDVTQDWDVRIEALGQKDPKGWDAQVWVQSIGTPEGPVPWADVKPTGDWTVVDSPSGAGGKALVSYGTTPRALEAHVHGSGLKIVYSRNAWNGLMRVVVNGQPHELDTWRKDFALDTFSIAAQPGAGDTLKDVHLSQVVSLRDLGTGALKIAAPAGTVMITRATLDGQPLQLKEGTVLKPPGRLGLVWLPALGIALVTALATLVVVPLLIRLVLWRPFWVGVVAVVIFKLWMISGDEMRASPWDARGYMLRSLEGVWSAPFTASAYERQPVYSLMIELNRLTGLPLRISLDLFYMGVCLVMALALPRLRIPRWAAWLAFALLALHPLTLPVFAFGYQDAAYTPVFLLGIAGLLHALGTRGLARLAWSVVAGAGIALAWNTRPEHVMLAALLAVWGAGLFAMEWVGSPTDSTARRPLLRRAGRALGAASLPLVPIVLVTASLTLSFAGMGRLTMGRFATSNFQLPGFTALYDELLAIQPADPKPMWPIPAEVREKAYAVSPTFEKLKPALEGPVLDTYAQLAEASTPVKGDYGIFIFWGLRAAPWYVQQWQSADQLDRFYAQAAAELRKARKGGLYKSRLVWAPYIDPAVRVWWPRVGPGALAYWKLLVRAEPELLAPEEANVEPPIFDKAALRRAAPAKDNHALWNATGRTALWTAKRAVAHTVAVFAWAGALLSPIALVVLLVRCIRGRSVETTATLAALVLIGFALASRFALMSVMHAVAFGVEARYILPVAPLLPLLAVMAAPPLVRAVLDARRARTTRDAPQ